MNGSFSRWILQIAAGILLAGSVASAGEGFADVGGVRVYLGVVPAAVARASLTPHVGPAAQDVHGRPVGSYEHHLVVALFDIASGRRIDDAIVSATAIAHGKSQKGKPLEPMRINDTVSYGNAFVLSEGAEYRIDVEIRLVGQTQPLKTSFPYRDPHQSAP